MRVGLNLSIPNYKNNINFGKQEDVPQYIKDDRATEWQTLVKQEGSMVTALIELRKKVGINVGEPITSDTMGQEIKMLLEKMYPG